VSDGTADGTSLLRDAVPGPSSNPPGPSVATLPDRLLFTMDDVVHGRELWTTDGTAIGTRLVADLVPGSAASRITDIASLDGAAYFIWEEPGVGWLLWRSDGTAEGTAPVEGGPCPCRVSSIVVSGERLFLRGSNVLFVSDGTGAGTQVAAVLPPGTFGAWMVPGPNGGVFFEGGDAAHGKELWYSDGTAAGTALVADLRPGTTSSFTMPLATGATLGYFTSNPGGGAGTVVVRSDGTPAGTFAVGTGSVGQGAAIGDVLVYRSGPGLRELWKSDGTVAGTFVIHADPSSGNGFRPTGFSRIGGRIWFRGCNLHDGCEPWSSDGTATGTVQVADLVTGEQDSDPGPPFVAAGSRVFFAADHVTLGRELWATGDAERPCADGVDNDGDLRVDYPEDLDCSSLEDPSEARTPIRCGLGAELAPVVVAIFAMRRRRKGRARAA
jgi:ELWxxDGT repeat protein